MSGVGFHLPSSNTISGLATLTAVLNATVRRRYSVGSAPVASRRHYRHTGRGVHQFVETFQLRGRHMSLVPCPDCRREVSDAAPACLHCGRPLLASATSPAAGSLYPYFPVATHKFIALSLCTLNFYTLYWCYNNWWRIQHRSGERISPFWRAIFAPIWVFSLFGRIGGEARARNLVVGWSTALLGVAYIVISAFGSVPEVWWLVSLASFVPFVPVVITTQRINALEAPVEKRNDSYSGGNVAAILLGGLFLLLALVGTFFPDEANQVVPDATESTTWQSSAPPVSMPPGREAWYWMA
jgi:hypothetical protein